MGRSGSWIIVAAVFAFPSLSDAHDIPNARVDRSTQVTLRRIGRHVAGFPGHGGDTVSGQAESRGLLTLALAGGMVPCWDAVGLVAVSAAVGRLGLGLFLAVAFGLGMALVPSAVGFVSGRLRRSLVVGKAGGVWQRRLGLASGSALAMMGVY